jgi:hypothetical protein
MKDELGILMDLSVITNDLHQEQIFEGKLIFNKFA